MTLAGKTALVTGAARRLGAQTARTLHENGANIIIHYGQSSEQADELVQQLNDTRPGSAVCMQASLGDLEQVERLAQTACAHFDGLDILVNNASSFYPTPLGSITEAHWDELFSSNLKGPLFLSQACHASLKETAGCIINMIDIHARRPLKNFSVYCAAKAGTAMLTRSMALEMGPDVRVNGVAPGAILWPENGDAEKQQAILEEIPLHRTGSEKDIADTVLFLVNSGYINGQIINVDGGRQLF